MGMGMEAKDINGVRKGGDKSEGDGELARRYHILSAMIRVLLLTEWLLQKSIFCVWGCRMFMIILVALKALPLPYHRSISPLFS